MTDFSSLILNARLWTILCLGSLGLIIFLAILGNVFGHFFGPRLWGSTEEMNRVLGPIVLPVFFGLFLLLGFGAVPLMTKLLVSGLERVWAEYLLAQSPLHIKAMSLLHRHHVHFVAGLWSVYLAGLIIAAPHIIREFAQDLAPPTMASQVQTGARAPKGAMPPLEYQVRYAKQILLLRTVIQDGAVRYGVLELLKQARPIFAVDTPTLLEINTDGFELLGYRPAHDRPVVMFFSEADSTGKTLFELLLPGPDWTMTYPAYAAPPDPTIEKVLTLEELRRIIASQ